MKTPAARPAVTIATLSLAWSIGTALPATADTRTDLSRTAPSEEALSSVPRPYLGWYQGAARTCPGLGWPVLAGIGEVESDHGQSPLPGVHSAANFAGAEGPMQFEPRTFAAYAVRADSHHALSVYNPEDAIFTAARMLCDEGAAGGTPQGIDTALYAYNHADWYPRDVLSWAARYAGVTATVVVRRSAPVPAEHSHADHHQDHPQPAHHVPPVHPAPAAAPTTRAGHTAATTHTDHIAAVEAPSFGSEAQQLAAEAGQLASEATLLSGEAQQLTTEARQLSGETQPLPSAAQPSATGAPTAPAPTAPAPTAPAPVSPATAASVPAASVPAAPVRTAPTTSGPAPASQAATDPAVATPAPAAVATSAPGTANRQQPPGAQQPKSAGEPIQGQRIAAEENPAPQSEQLAPPQSPHTASGPSSSEAPAHTQTP